MRMFKELSLTVQEPFAAISRGRIVSLASLGRARRIHLRVTQLRLRAASHLADFVTLEHSASGFKSPAETTRLRPHQAVVHVDGIHRKNGQTIDPLSVPGGHLPRRYAPGCTQNEISKADAEGRVRQNLCESAAICKRIPTPDDRPSSHAANQPSQHPVLSRWTATPLWVMLGTARGNLDRTQIRTFNPHLYRDGWRSIELAEEWLRSSSLRAAVWMLPASHLYPGTS